MMKNTLIIFLIGLSITGFSQRDSIAEVYANTITAEELREHLTIIASDEFEGRETGMEGQKKAAKYIAEYFENLGIEPIVDGSYYQEFPLKRESSKESKIVIKGKEFNFIDDFFFFPGFESGIYNDEELVFVGYGIKTDEYNDYANKDVKGKFLVMLEGEPIGPDDISLATGEKGMSEWSGDWKIKRELAEKMGAKGILFIKQDYNDYMSRVKYWLENPGMRLDYEVQRGEVVIPVLFMKESISNALFGSGKIEAWKMGLYGKKKKKIKTKSKVNIHINKNKEMIQSENVLCYIEGSDPKLKDEVVVITAHYDHVGIQKGEIHNGADDDGSGTVSALELAQAFVAAKEAGHGTRRSILVMTVSGEEKGLLGSEWYSEHPIFPLEKTVCNLNIDMIGRLDEAHKDNENYVYLIGSDKLSTDLHKISENANKVYTGIDLDYTFNEPDDPNRFYYRSDHYNFAKHNIPVIFYFSGVHEDYHKPGDDVEKILFNKMENIVKLVFYTAWDVANRDEKLVVDVENDFE